MTCCNGLTSLPVVIVGDITWRALTYRDGEATKLTAHAHGVWWTLSECYGRVRCWFEARTGDGGPMVVPVFHEVGTRQQHFANCYALVAAFTPEKVTAFAEVEDARLGAALREYREGMR